MLIGRDRKLWSKRKLVLEPLTSPITEHVHICNKGLKPGIQSSTLWRVARSASAHFNFS